MVARSLRLLTALAWLAPVGARAQDAAPIGLELNKLEPVPAAAGQAASCRAYLVATNPDGAERVEQLRLDLVLFGTDGVIAKRLALDVGPLAPGRIQVRPFELRDEPCDTVGSMLVNDTLLCRIGGADRTDCMDRLRTTSRVGAKLTK